MVLLVISVIIFNTVAYKMKNQHLTKNQIVHIWAFTIIFITWADLIIDEKTGGYWYFDKGIEWHNFLVYTILVPPVNIIFLNWYPYHVSWLKKIRYYIFWITFITVYELIALLPEPWGFFHYGWWKMQYSIMLDPFLLLSLRAYYKWICKIEK
ncbi:hypothetical protein [Bacillus benzoevorans]|uniref:Uncharacterized protein n=1 Tax=Bacillus benzoevorans TaxID=1456 RepID=A0A7X0HNJ1_9BACI|nr:hypothetical protein [Bacillus benzoevorans]MBB6444068.1 hypothetical protein [Bacillus benzoevorans]